jgi:arsenate reductase (thioredoxin)
LGGFDPKLRVIKLLFGYSFNKDFMQNVLVLCTGNSCRSQIAEGYLKFFTQGKANIYSAGIETHGVNARAIRTMREDGIDISKHTSNNVSEYMNISFDFVITVCDNAHENCPYFPTLTSIIHQNFADPAKATGTEQELDEAFRKVRKEIKKFCRVFVMEHLRL